MTEGQTPAGWYDDGHGQLRWYDGTAWTEHVQPLPAPTPAPTPEPAAAPQAQAAPVAQPVAQQPVAAQPAADPLATAAAAGTGAAAGGAIGAPGSHTPGHGHGGSSFDEPTPIYRKTWFLVVLGLVVLAVIAGIFLLASGGSDDDNAAVTPPASGVTTGGAAAGGAVSSASTVATKAGCTGATPTTPAASTAPTGVAPNSFVTCTLNGAQYTVASWATAADQAAPGSLAKAFPQPVTAGTKYYATGPGWVAYDAATSQAGAQAFATPAGGTTKGVVVVLGGSTPAPSVG